jgi:hypothetical protein
MAPHAARHHIHVATVRQRPSVPAAARAA